MDLKHAHPTQVHIVRASTCDDATDLVAVGGEHSVDVVLVVRAFLSVSRLAANHWI